MLSSLILMSEFNINNTLSSLGYFFCDCLFQAGPSGYSVPKKELPHRPAYGSLETTLIDMHDTPLSIVM